MIRIRHVVSGGQKASPQTLCQKCLKRDDYECKASTQERPYASRPSRTQQLANPKLVPKLTSDIPNDLLRKKGIADEQLAKKEEERGRKRALDENYPAYGSTKRSRSRSSYSSTSVSTISTNRSPSISFKGPKSRQPDAYHLSQSRSIQPHREQGTHKRRRSSSSTSEYSSSSSLERRRPSRRRDDDRNTRRRRSSISPDIRGRDRDYNGHRSSRRTRSRSNSMDRSRIARNRNSITPAIRSSHNQDGGRSTTPRRNGRRYSTNDDDRYGGSYRDEGRGIRDGIKSQRPSISLAKRERSLSPFSKRLALTQAMNLAKG